MAKSKIEFTTPEIDRILGKHAKAILIEIGIGENHTEHWQSLYDLRYAIYRKISEAFSLKDK